MPQYVGTHPRDPDVLRTYITSGLVRNPRHFVTIPFAMDAASRDRALRVIAKTGLVRCADLDVLGPTERLALRPGERVQLIVVRRPDPSRWKVDKLAMTVNGEDLALAEEGLADLVETLEGGSR